MNKIELMLVTQKVLFKLFDDKNVLGVCYSPKDANKISFTVVVDGTKFFGCIFHNNKLTVKDVRNILFAYKKNCLKALGKEVKNANSTGTNIREGVCSK